MIKKLPNDIWVLENDTHISKWVEEHNSLKCDPHLFEWLQPRIQDCKVAWDIGANIGDHTRFYLDCGMEVVALEPNPEAFRCLCHNCSEAICYNLAASDGQKELTMALEDNVGASYVVEGGAVMVVAAPLDNVVRHHKAPDYIKIDVEGFESKALTGMEQLLANSKPKLFIEFNDGALRRNGSSSADLKKQIESYGYTRFEIYPPNATLNDPQYDLFFF
jgi:FkbM family methyltransferase